MNATTSQIMCDVCEESVDNRDYIRVEEGGDVPARIVCADCLFSDEFAEKYVLATDNAVIAEGHDCLVRAEARGMDDVWECSMCNLMLERSGDALVMPD